MNGSTLRHVRRAAGLVIGVVFAYAGLAKVLVGSEFADAIYSYHVLPNILIGPVAQVLPTLEILLGLSLMASYRRRVMLCVALALMAGFMALMLQGYARGLNLTCGCFGAANETIRQSLVRDGVLLAGIVCLLVLDARLEPTQGARSTIANPTT